MLNTMDSPTTVFLRFLFVVFNITAVILCLCYVAGENLDSAQDGEGLFPEAQDDIEDGNFWLPGSAALMKRTKLENVSVPTALI